MWIIVLLVWYKFNYFIVIIILWVGVIVVFIFIKEEIEVERLSYLINIILSVSGMVMIWI